MSTIRFECPSCTATIKAPEDKVGRKARCPKCKEVIVIGGEGSTPPSEPDAPDFGDPDLGSPDFGDPDLGGADPGAPDRDTGPEPEPDPEPEHEAMDDAAVTRPRRRAGREVRSAGAAASGSSPMALVAGAVVAVVGAVVWAAIAYVGDVEIGWIAWGIGAGVGGACAALGGRGTGMATICAGMALVSIVGGWFASSYLMIDKYFAEELPQAAYDSYKASAQAFARLPADATEEQLRHFMLEHGFTDREEAKFIPEEDVQNFRRATGVLLRSFAAEAPSISEWRDRFKPPLLDVVKANFDLYSVLFLVLGVGTAFGIVQRRSEESAAEERAAERKRRRREAR